ncbi:hypothetical protein TSOC_007502 [Tetrabaena socialis]|uniref:Uncharacterized protein n=1 Tax=Tetrabaena socialis TaxID=47790 RepID=A0A2J8A0V4_9CHLO|nr:hypothetical protein TSOC_007502 [Tetrabaena socialis]|eukprot:PNH06152.1 hypothetical protein TSOC_007502 [Tetrabaena socialis]
MAAEALDARGVGDPLDVNATCAEATLGFSLKPDSWYTLRLPAGTRYSPQSGPLAVPSDIPLAGLRPFRLGLKTFTQPRTVRYRRLRLWLPHGLSPDTPLSALACRISICELVTGACTPLAFELVPFSLSEARLVAALQPGRRYMVNVTADAAVKDGYDQGLEASSTSFWTGYVPWVFAAPSLRGADVAIMEEGADPLAEWPYLTRAPPPRNVTGVLHGSYEQAVSLYDINAGSEADVVKLFSLLKGDDPDMASVATAFGRPSAQVKVPPALSSPGSGAEWATVRLPLAGSSRIRAAYTCCTPGSTAARAQFLLSSSLQASVVQSAQGFTAWVTDAALGGGGPVAGADVSFYTYLQYLKRSKPVKAAACKTDARGFCAVTIDLAPGQVRGHDRPRAGPGWCVWGAVGVGPYLGSLVVDRLLVTPGDTLLLTGFVQQASMSGLQLPPSSYARIQAEPSRPSLWST